jgi:putative tricarboxylic transport membrane protein
LKLWPTREEFRRAWPAIIRGTGVGAVVGILPGGGATLGAFISYIVEKKVAKNPALLGTGMVEGVAAPEAANNAGAQSSFIPMLSLGIPGNATMAVMMAAMLIHGIQPGPQMITEKPEMFFGLIASMWVGNCMLLVINLPLIGIWVKLLKIPYRFLYIAILVFCTIGVFVVRNNVQDVFIATGFTLLSFFFIRYNCEPAPLVLGFVLGPLMEVNLRRSMLMSRGEWMIFFERPISLGLLMFSLALMFLLILPGIKKIRRVAFQEEK